MLIKSAFIGIALLVCCQGALTWAEENHAARTLVSIDSPVKDSRLVPLENKAEADALVLFLTQQKAVENYATPEFSGRMLRLATLGDQRALPLLEWYLRLRGGLHSPLTDNRQIGEDRQSLEPLYWRLRFRGTSLQRKVAELLEWGYHCDSVNSGLVVRPIGGISAVLAEEGDSLVPPLRAIIKSQKTSYCLHEASVHTLAQIGSAAAIEVLRQATQSRHEARHQLARAMLLKLKDPAIVADEFGRVMQILSEHSLRQGTYVTTAIWNTEKLADAGADLEKLESALQFYVSQGDSAALMVLRNFGTEKSIDSLLRFIAKRGNEKGSTLSVASALTTLSVIGKRIPEKVLPVLHIMIRSEDVALRIAAVQGVVRLGDKRAIPVLEELAKHEKDEVALRFERQAIESLHTSVVVMTP